MKKYIYVLTCFAFSLPSFFLGSEPLDASVNLFASHFYQESLAGSNKNELFSPYCLFNCLSMAYIGSDGPTEMEIRKALCLEISQEDLPKSINDLAYRLLPHNRSFQLNIANSVWIDRNAFLLSSYQQILQKDFLADVESLDFRKSAQTADLINQWVSQKTCNTIQKLLGPQDISRDTQLMLVSALYFKDDWAKPFKLAKTHQDLFYTTPHKSKTIPMMSQIGEFSYYENSEMQLVLLPFSGKNATNEGMACFFILPKTTLKEIEDRLHELPINEWISSSEKMQIKVEIPRFEMRLNYDLIPALNKLGIHEAFSTRANFSKINGRFDLSINKAIQEAFFSLNEKGVTASAATAIGIGMTCVREEPSAIPFTANHPFLFGIVDLKSNVMLFLGKMIEP